MGKKEKFRVQRDPKVIIRAKTSVKIASAVVVYCLLFFISALNEGIYKLKVILLFKLVHVVVPPISFILGACYLTITVTASIMGTLKNNIEAIKGGFVGCLVAYVSFR